MRDLTDKMREALAAGQLAPIMLIEAEFPAGGIYCWEGVGNVSWNGKRFIGLGDLISVEPITETADGRAEGARFVVSGLRADFFDPVQLGDYQGGAVRLWFGLVDIDSAEIIANPVLWWEGKLDSDEIVDNPATGEMTLTIIAEHELLSQLRPRSYLYTDEDQDALYNTGGIVDKGLEFVPAIQVIELK